MTSEKTYPRIITMGVGNLPFHEVESKGFCKFSYQQRVKLNDAVHLHRQVNSLKSRNPVYDNHLICHVSGVGPDYFVLSKGPPPDD